MLHYYGDITGMELAEKARFYIPLYLQPDKSVVLVPFMDLERKRKRYVKFEKAEGVSGWIYTDMVD
jgi:hypothetical protein